MSTPGTTAVATALGMLMVAATEVQPSGPGLVAAGLAAAAVLVSIVWRPAATVAAGVSAVLIAFGGPAPVLAALSGLAAAGYLLLRHTASADRIGGPSVAAASGFAAVAAAVISIPLELSWVPLLAPLGVIAIYLLAVRPFLPD